MKKQNPAASPTQTRWSAPLQILAAVFLIFWAAPLLAANRTWIASPADAFWSNAGNWGGTAPVAADVILFGDSAITNLNNDLAANIVLNGITFNTTTNSSYVFTNNTINLAGNVTDNSTNTQTINIGLNMTAARTANIINGGNLVIGGVISQTAAGFGFTAAQQPGYNLNIGTLKLNGSAVNAYSGVTTIGQGITLFLDFANLTSPVNLISNASAITLSGGIYSLLGKSTGATFQTNNGTFTLNAGGNGITLNPNGGIGTTLTLGNTWTRNANATLNVDISAGGTLNANPALGNGILGYATVKDGTSAGFATTNSTGGIVRYLGATNVLANNSNSGVTNFVTSGNLTMSAASFAVNSLTLDATAGNGVLDLGGATDAMTNTSRGILMIGANNYIIQNGQIAAPGTEAIVHQMGSGILTLNGTIGNTTTTLTKNGNGTLVLNGASTNAGAVVINRGTIKAGISTVPAISGALGNGNNPLTVNAVGILDLNGNNVGVGQFNSGNGVITNSGSLASFTVGNNNATKNVANTLFTGPLQLIANGNGTWTAVGTSANSHTGGTIFTNNGAINHRVNVTSFFGTGTIFFKNGGNLQNTVALVVTNPVNISGAGNIWNWQLNSAVNPCVTMLGPWTGNGTLHLDQGFNNPIFLFNGNDMSGFTGTAQLQAGGTVGAVYSINTTNAVFDASQSTWDVGSISGASAVTVLQSISTNSGTVIRLGALTTAGSLGSGIPTLRNNAGNTTNIFEVGALNANNTFTGVISDGQNSGAILGLTKVGTGIWTLTASEAYSGPTTISNGILVANGSLSGNQFAAAPVNVYAPGALGGSGSIASSVTLSSGNAGILLTNNAGATLSLNGGLTLNNGNVLAFDLGTVSDQIAVSGGFTMNGTTTVNLAAIGGFGLGTYTLILGAGIASTNGFVLGSAPSGYAATLISDGSSLQVQITTSIPTSAFWNNHVSLIWNGHTGSIYNWDTDQSSGINASNAPGNPTDVTFAANGANNFNTILGADFGIHSLTFNTPSSVTIGGANALTLNGGITVNPGAGANTINASSVILGVDQTWSVADSGTALTVSSPVSGAHVLTVSGSGSVLLNAHNSFSGGTTISGTTLAITNTDAIGTGPLTLNNGAFTIGGTNTLTNSIGLLSSETIIVSNVTDTLTLSGTIANNGSMTKAGAGTLVLPNVNNSYSGGTTISTGLVMVTTNGALGSGSVSISSGGALSISGAPNNYNFPNSFSGAGTITVTPTAGQVGISGDLSSFIGTINVISNNTINVNKFFLPSAPSSAATINIANGATLFVAPLISGSPFDIPSSIFVSGTGNTENLGAIRLDSGSSISGPITLLGDTAIGARAGNAGTISGVIGDGGNGFSVTKVGPQTNILSGANTYSGTTTVTAGVLDIANSLALQNSTLTSGGAGIIFDSAVSPAAFTLGGLSGNASLGLTNTAGAPIALTAGNNNSSTTDTGVLSDGGTGATLTKIGTGILAITGASTYSGLTTVSNGTLVISTLYQGGGDFLINDGKKFGAINAGSGSALLGNLTLGNNTGLTTLMLTNVSSTTVPVINATNTVTVIVTNTIQIASTNGLVTGNTYPLLKYGSLAGAGFAGFGLSTPTSMTAMLTNDIGNSWIALKVTLVGLAVNPTPTNITLVVTNGGLLMSWPADHTGWTLQSQTNSLNVGLGTNWVDMPGSTSTNAVFVPITTTNGTVFYRMKL